MRSLPRTPSFSLSGRRALVCGASRGIGAAGAAALVDAGAEVTLCARGKGELEGVAALLRERASAPVHALPLDVTDAGAVAAALAERGPFQIIVNSAGTNRPALITDTTNDDVDLLLDLNLRSAFVLLREAARSLLSSGGEGRSACGGSFITISSQMGHVGGPKRALYCATKHAVEGMTKALAWELGPAGIRVNTICPTFIETAMTAPMFADAQFRQYVLSRIALGRLGQLEDIMGAVLFLASDASSLVTGSALMVDGGWTAA